MIPATVHDWIVVNGLIYVWSATVSEHGLLIVPTVKSTARLTVGLSKEE